MLEHLQHFQSHCVILLQPFVQHSLSTVPRHNTASHETQAEIHNIHRQPQYQSMACRCWWQVDHLHAVWNSQTFSVLWRCWLGGRKGIWPVKNGCWHGYLFGARCRLAYGPADAIATHCLLLQWNPAFTFLLPAHPGSPGHWAIKRVCVCSTPAYLMLPASSCF